MGKPKNIAKEDLVLAAKKQLSLKGRGKLTLKSVGEAAGVTQGVVYYHFKTKDELLISIYQDFFHAVKKQMEELRSEKVKKNFLKEEMYKARTRTEQHALFFELISLSLHQKDFKAVMNSAVKEKVRLMTEAFDGNQAKGRIAAALMDGLSLQALYDPNFDEQALLDTVKQCLEAAP